VNRIFKDTKGKDARRDILPGILVVLLLLALPVISSDQNPKRMLIQVRQCTVRSGPSFMASSIGDLAYNDPVVVQEETGSWRKIAAEGKKVSGWLHSAAICKPVLAFADGTLLPAGTNVSTREVVTAGRSIFSEETETAVRAKYPDLNFDFVNKMESLRIRTDKMADFARKGGLMEEKKK
jgi:hypothetical protein